MNGIEVSKKIKALVRELEKENILSWISRLLSEFPKSDVYLVGGSIRDFLLQRERPPLMGDYDFVVTGVVQTKLADFLGSMGTVNLVGKKFGVLKFKPADSRTTIDIALPRVDHSVTMSGKKRDFRIISDPNLPIEEDLSRRDLTINSLALSLRGRRLIDPFGGLKDIKKGIVKTVGVAEQRFQEDYSRILRSLRFACQLDFDIERKTFYSVKNLINNINRLPYEIVACEMLKTFVSNPLRAFDLYDKSGAFSVLIPEVSAMKGCQQSKELHTEGDVFDHTRLALKMLQSKTFKRDFLQDLDSEIVFAVLFHDIGKPRTRRVKTGKVTFYGHARVGAKEALRICKRLKLSSPKGLGIKCNNLDWLVRNHLLIVNASPNNLSASTLEKYFYNPAYPGKNLLRLFLVDSLATIPLSGKADVRRFKELLARLKKLEIKDRSNLPKPILNGHEIMKILGSKEGSHIGRIKGDLREMQLTGKIRTKKDATKYLTQNYLNY